MIQRTRYSFSRLFLISHNISSSMAIFDAPLHLFFLHPYLLVKVRTRFLASWRPLTGLFHHPPFFCRRGRTPVNVFGFFDKPARLTAGLVLLPADCLRIQLSVDRKSLQTLLLNKLVTFDSGPEGIRTPGLLSAIEARSQLRYRPILEPNDSI